MSRQLVASHGDECLQPLYATKDSRIAQDVAIGSIRGFRRLRFFVLHIVINEFGLQR